VTAKKFDISLAAWSLHKEFFAKQIDQLGMLDACAEAGITGFEMVNTFFPSPQYQYLKQLSKRAEDAGIRLLLIMCDGEGSMAGPDKDKRLLAAKNHHKWIDIAAVLGCHSIRCNTGAQEGDDDALDRCAESFAALVEYADKSGINVTIENHWGLSSDPAWLMALMEKVNHPRFGTLPDFGNFPDTVDRYDAVTRMMPRAKAVSAKCYDFDDATGNETKVDFDRMMKIVLDAGYSGYVGIEYEGERLSERQGIAACKKLLERYQ
jgi:sugar phosphate isomerase/epimerase